MAVIGNPAGCVYAVGACWRMGAVALPCTLQLRSADLRARMDAVEPAAVIADEATAETVRAAGFTGPVLLAPGEELFDAAPLPAAELAPGDPALVVFTSG